MIVYKVFLKEFSKQGCSLFVVKETNDLTMFLSNNHIIFPYFNEKQTRLLEYVLRETKEKLSGTPDDLYEEVRVEIWIPPAIFFYSKLERRFLRQLTTLYNNLATNSKTKISIKSYKPALKSFLLYRKMMKASKLDIWYSLQNSIPSINITEY